MLQDGRARRNIQRSASFRSLVARYSVVPTSVTKEDFYFAALWDTALDHHRAIGDLLFLENSTSALALLRSFIETSYRLIWLRNCASPKALQRITRFARGSFPDISRIISDLVRKSGISEFSTSLPNLDMLNDFTHSGPQHLVRQFQRVEQRSECFEQDVLTCVVNSDRVLLTIGMTFQAAFGSGQVQSLLQIEFSKLIQSYEPPPNDRRS